jgi:hypothetical protein
LLIPSVGDNEPLLPAAPRVLVGWNPVFRNGVTFWSFATGRQCGTADSGVQRAGSTGPAGMVTVSFNLLLGLKNLV